MEQKKIFLTAQIRKCFFQTSRYWESTVKSLFDGYLVFDRKGNCLLNRYWRIRFDHFVLRDMLALYLRLCWRGVVGGLQEAAVRAMFLPRRHPGAPNVWADRLEHPVWVQRDGPAYLRPPAPHVHQRVRRECHSFIQSFCNFDWQYSIRWAQWFLVFNFQTLYLKPIQSSILSFYSSLIHSLIPFTMPFLHSFCLSWAFIPSLYPCHSFLHSFPGSVYPCRMYNTMRCAIWRESVTTAVEWRTIRTGAPCWRSSTITTVRRSSRTRGTASTTAGFTTHHRTERSVLTLN